MDKISCVLGCFCLAVIILSAHGADPPLQLKFITAPSIQVRTGGQFILNCTLNKGLSIILDYKIHYVHKSLVEPSEEKELTEQQGLLPAAHPDSYSIVFNYDSGHTYAALTVKNVENKMDGHYICRAKNIKDTSLPALDAEVEVSVFSDVQAVELTVGSYKVNEITTVPLVLDQGSYSLECTAKGFNSDAADVAIMLDGNILPTTTAAKVFDPVAAKAAGARRYSLTVRTGEPLTLRPSNQNIQCTASARDAKAVPKTSSAPLNIVFVEPEVKCVQNVSAMPGDKYVQLRCTITTNNVTVEKYSWVIGNTQRVISLGETDMNTYDEIFVEPKGDVTEVILSLHQVTEEHFETEYYLDIHVPNREGGPIREAVTLVRLPPTPGSGSPSLASTSLLIALTAAFPTFLLIRA